MNTKSVFSGLSLALGLFGVVSVSPVQAFNFISTSEIGVSASDVNGMFTVNFDGNVGGTTVTGLTSQAKFTLFSFTPTQAVFDISLKNTSTTGITSRTSVLGWDTTPPINSAAVTGDFDVYHLGGSFPNGFGSIGVCFKDGGPNTNCQGGGGGGILTDETGEFRTTINWSSPQTVFTLSNFGVRYQSINGPSFNGASGTGMGEILLPDPSDPVGVPEPSTILGSLAMLGMCGYLGHRKKQQAKQKVA